MKQKFFRGQRVRLATKFPKMMDHFGGKGREAVVEYSYSDVYGLGNFSDFQLLIILEKDEMYRSAWYPDHLMTLVSNNREAGERIIQRYNENILEEDALEEENYMED